MKASDNALNIIKKWESCKDRLGNGLIKAYWDDIGEVWTIAWGSVRSSSGKPVEEGLVIDQLTADRWLQAEVDECAKVISDKYPKVISDKYPKVNQNQFDALVSLAYNQGSQFGETLNAALIAGDWELAGKTLLEYHHADDADVQGLKNRRADEFKLFNTPVADAPINREATWLEVHRLDQGGRIETGVAAMSGADCVATWSGIDKKALIDFLQRFPGANNVLVAPKDKPWPAATAAKPTEVFLKLQRTGTKEDAGCDVLLLTMEGTNKSWYCRSGQPWAQVFEAGSQSNRPGSMRPLPAGEYGVGNIEFAGARDDYSTSHGEGLGPVWVALTPRFSTARGGFGAHLDAGAYGTAGCIGLKSIEDVKSFVAALRQYDPRRLVVEW